MPIQKKFNFEAWHKKMYNFLPGEENSAGLFYEEINDLLDAAHSFYMDEAIKRGAITDQDLDDMEICFKGMQEVNERIDELAEKAINDYMEGKDKL